jgi:nitric oxide reductase NorD protein
VERVVPGRPGPPPGGAPGPPPGGAGAAVRRAGLLARGLSEGRRTGFRLASVDGTWWTDLEDVVATWPLPAPALSHPRGLSACIALQSSPTKEAVATLDARDFSFRELAALQLCEGAAAVRWAHDRWPGLAPAIDELTGGLAGEPWEGASAQELAARARELAAEQRGTIRVPPVLGQLPLRWGGSSTYDLVRRKMGWRLRLLGEALERLGGRAGAPIPIEGADDAGAIARLPIANPDAERDIEASRAGIPFPEWNEPAQSYLRDFTRVIEMPRRRGDRSPRRHAPELEGWFSQPLDRRWRSRLPDGSDVDIDGVVEDLVDVATGGQPSERLYRDRLRCERDVACAVLIDSSGSLGHEALLDHEVACADALVDAMEGAGERHGVFAFWSNGRHKVAIDVLRDFGELAGRPGTAALRPTGHTRLGAAIRAVTARLLAETAGRRVLLILTDGRPFDDGYEGDYACADVAKAVEEAERVEVAIAILAVGEESSAPLAERLGSQLHPVAELGDLAAALGDVHQRLVA